jgi:RNA polymerase sigma-70 factor (ECF subfamily)
VAFRHSGHRAFFMPSATSRPDSELHAWYVDHGGWLLAWLKKKLGCPHNAADMAHDTFARILASRDALSAVREPRAFLSVTASRLIIDQARRRQVEEAYLAELSLAMADHPGAPSPEQILMTSQALAQISAILEGLAERPRQAFLLHYLDGDTHAEIAAKLAVTDRMVRKYLVSALLHCHDAVEA